jgi:hypothetical protein
MGMKPTAGMFGLLCRQHGLPEPTPEFRFAPPRRWRLDYAWVDDFVGLEIQGGVFTRGRHTQGAALRDEYEKLNALAVRGWRMLFALPEQVDSGAIFETIRKALGATEAAG